MTTPHRKKMCEDCAFRKESLEMNDPELKDNLWNGLYTAVFYCHQTMFRLNPEEGLWRGEYDPERDNKGEACARTSHQVCAGYAAMFGDHLGIDSHTIDIIGHHNEAMLRSDREIEREVRAEKEVAV